MLLCIQLVFQNSFYRSLVRKVNVCFKVPHRLSSSTSLVDALYAELAIAVSLTGIFSKDEGYIISFEAG